MPALQWLFASILLLLALHTCFTRKRNPKLPPTPPQLPIIGNLHQLGSSPHLSLHRLAKRFGPIIHLKLGEIPTVVVSSPRMAEQVLKTHDLALASRPRLFSARHLFYDCSDMVFAPYGDYWRKVRKICILELLSLKRVQSYALVREDEVDRLVRRLTAFCRQSGDGTANLTKALQLYATNLLCRTTLGKDFSEEGEFDKHGFQNMLDDFQALLGGFSVGEFFPSMEFVHALSGMKSKLLDTCRRFDRFFDEVIDEHLQPGRETENKDLVAVLLALQKQGSEDTPLTMDNVKAIILDMFAAGIDTTFITLDWGMTELATHPRIMEKAQAEVRSVVGERRRVTESDLPRLHYLRALIKEILRLHPPAPMLVPRESMEDVTIDGYEIPAKTRFYVNAWAVGRDAGSWEEAERFEPERFLGKSIDFKGQDFELIPFGAGRRGCPGLSFGVASVELPLAQLLHSFEWELPPGTEVGDLDMREAFGISMHRISDLIVVPKPSFE